VSYEGFTGGGIWTYEVLNYGENWREIDLLLDVYQEAGEWKGKMYAKEISSGKELNRVITLGSSPGNWWPSSFQEQAAITNIVWGHDSYYGRTVFEHKLKKLDGSWIKWDDSISIVTFCDPPLKFILPPQVYGGYYLYASHCVFWADNVKVETLYSVNAQYELFLQTGSGVLASFQTYGGSLLGENWACYNGGLWADWYKGSKKISRSEPVEMVKLYVKSDAGKYTGKFLIDTFVMTKSVLVSRYLKIKTEYVKPGADKPALAEEYLKIKIHYIKAPSTSPGGTGLGSSSIQSTEASTASGASSNPGGTIVEVMQGQPFLLRYRLCWDEPGTPGFYGIGIYWYNYENRPEENLTFLYSAAYFDDDGDNEPDPGVAPIENAVTLEAVPSGADTMYILSVEAATGDPRDGTFNVDIWVAAAGEGGVPHSPTDNHPIWHTMDSISVAESTIVDVPAGPITTRVFGVDVSISPSEDSGPPGATLNYTITVANKENVEDNYVLTVSDDAGWGLTLSENLFDNVQPGENRIATLSVAIPENVVGCIRDNITVKATSIGDPSVSASDTCVAYAAKLIYLTDDADVYERYPNNNYGSDTSIWVSPYDNRKNRGFLKFSLSEIPSGVNILDAKLHLNCWKKEYDDFDAASCEVENDNWSENVITWNNQPSYGGILDVIEITGIGWYTWDVTSFVDQEFKDDKVVSFCLKGAVEPHGGRALFDSKEWYDNHQYLEVVYGLLSDD